MEKKKKLDEWEFLELGNVIRGKSKGGQPVSENYENFTAGG